MRARSLVAAAIFAVGLPISAGQAFDDPKALLNAIYEPMTHGQKPTDLMPFYSNALKLKFIDRARSEPGDGAAATQPGQGSEVQQVEQHFDPFVSSANVLLFDLNIADPVVMGDRAVATVSYHNFDHPALLSIALVKENDGWKVDDVASMGPDQHWLLSWLLTNDPWAN